MEAAILNGGSDAGELLNIFARSITEWAKEGEDTSGEDDDNESEGGMEAEEKNTTNKGKKKQATAETLTTIANDCDEVLAFLQAVAFKSPQVTAAPIYLRANKRARVWFRRWTDTNLPTPPNLPPLDHMGLTGVLTNGTTRLHTVEALHPVAAAQREAEKETKGWDRLPPTAYCVILAASATNGTSITTLPPPTIHCFLNTRNTTSLQAVFSLTYAGKNLSLPTSLCQALLQGNILAIPDPDASMGLSPLMNLPSSAGPANAHQRAMRIQILLSMGGGYQGSCGGHCERSGEDGTG